MTGLGGMMQIPQPGTSDVPKGLNSAMGTFNDKSNSDNDAYASFWDYLNNSFSGNLDYKRQIELLEKEQAFNREEAEKNRVFQLEFSNTAYQRQADDLRKAGYNPGLILGQGGAYHTASGSQANSTSKQTISAGTQMTTLLNTAVNSAFKIVEKLIPTGGQIFTMLTGMPFK